MPNLVLMLVLVALGCVLLLVLVLVVLRLGGRLARIEQLLEEEAAARSSEPLPLPRAEPMEGSEAQRKEFEEFLAEDESRRGLSKKEQFAAYRSWRKDRGLTWGS